MTKCFLIRQKCIKWFSLCFSTLLGYLPIPDLELPKKLFVCLDVLGELWLSQQFWVAFFVSSEVVSYTDRSGQKFEDKA